MHQIDRRTTELLKHTTRMVSLWRSPSAHRAWRSGREPWRHCVRTVHKQSAVACDLKDLSDGLLDYIADMLGKATDVVEARAAFEHAAAPSLNVGLADDSGNIGYALVGRVPIRGDGCPPGGELFPLVGWTGENDWQGLIPWDQMPHSLNPSEGKIVSANHRIVPTTDAVHLGDIWVAGWRAVAIHDGIDSMATMSLDDCQALQMDFRCIPGERLRDFFTASVADVEAQGLTEVENAALKAFVSWDGRMEIDSVGASLYELTSDVSNPHPILTILA